jgi:hypothetical protein
VTPATSTPGTGPAVNLPHVVAQVRAELDRYEAALTSNDIPVLVEQFWASDATIRITTFGEDVGVATVEFTRDSTGRQGRQSQTWVRFADGWRVVHAHVSLLST